MRLDPPEVTLGGTLDTSHVSPVSSALALSGTLGRLADEALCVERLPRAAVIEFERYREPRLKFVTKEKRLAS